MAIVFAVLAATACGGSTSDTAAPAAADSGAPAPSASSAPVGSSTPQPPDDAGSTKPSKPTKPGDCHDLVDDGPDAVMRMVAADAPTPTGGTIAPGKYHLVDVSVFTGSSGASGPLVVKVTSTMRVTGNVLDMVLNSPQASGRNSGQLDTSGSELTFRQTCPTNKERTGPYSAGTSLVMFEENDAGQVVAYTYEPAK